MTKKRVKELERLHLLCTLVRYGPMSAADLAERANTECEIDAFDALPEISPRGITMKLQGMSLDGLVVGEYPGGGDPMLWRVAAKGRDVAAVIIEERP